MKKVRLRSTTYQYYYYLCGAVERTKANCEYELWSIELIGSVQSVSTGRSMQAQFAVLCITLAGFDQCVTHLSHSRKLVVELPLSSGALIIAAWLQFTSQGMA